MKRPSTTAPDFDSRDRREARRMAVRFFSLILLALSLLIFAATPAKAVEIHAPKSSFDVSGSTTSPNSLAVDEETGDVYLMSKGGSTPTGDVLKFDAGGNPVNFAAAPGPNETQKVTFSGFSTGDLFTLTCPNGETTGEIVWNSNAATLRGNMLAGLEAKCGAGNFSISSGPNNPVVEFEGAFASTNVPQMVCTKTAGAGSCEITEENDGSPETNVLDTPCGSSCRSIAVDNSAGPNQGVIYVSRSSSGSSAEIAVYLPTGESAGSITTRSVGGDNSAFCGVAVDDDGSVYASHSSSSSTSYVDMFEPLEWATNPAQEPPPTATIRPLGITPCKMAVDTSSSLSVLTGTGSTSTGTVSRFAGSDFGPPEEPFSLGTGTELIGSVRDVAVDLSTDRLYLTKSGEVLGFDTSNTQLEKFGSEQLTNSAQGLTVNAATGDLYVSDFSNDEVSIFEEVLAPLPTTEGTTNLLRNSVTIEGHVEPDGAGDVTACQFEYGPSTSYGEMEPCSGTLPFTAGEDVSADLTGLETDTTYHYRVVVENANPNSKNAGEDMSFTTPTAVADTTTEAASDRTHTTAKLNGSFTGDGLATDYWFEWGPTSSYGTIVPAGPTSNVVGPVSVSAEVEGLTVYLPESQSYHYRLVTENSTGVSYGADEAFFAAPPAIPAITGTEVKTVNPTVATVGAQINPGNGATAFVVQYGTTTSYGSVTPASGSIGEDNSTHDVEAQLTGLTPGTIYHFRVVATNFGGTGSGPDLTFITPGRPRIDATAASGIAETTASLTALVAGNGRPTSVSFQYGPTTAYGYATAALPAGEGLQPTPVVAGLIGLVPRTVYHYRTVAVNEIGVTYGPDQLLTTLGSVAPPPEPGPDCDGFERRAKRNSNRAKQLRRKAKKGSNRKQKRKLRKRASSHAQKARSLTKQAKSCRRERGA